MCLRLCSAILEQQCQINARQRVTYLGRFCLTFSGEIAFQARFCRTGIRRKREKSARLRMSHARENGERRQLTRDATPFHVRSLRGIRLRWSDRRIAPVCCRITFIAMFVYFAIRKKSCDAVKWVLNLAADAARRQKGGCERKGNAKQGARKNKLRLTAKAKRQASEEETTSRGSCR